VNATYREHETDGKQLVMMPIQMSDGSSNPVSYAQDQRLPRQFFSPYLDTFYLHRVQAKLGSPLYITRSHYSQKLPVNSEFVDPHPAGYNGAPLVNTKVDLVSVPESVLKDYATYNPGDTDKIKKFIRNNLDIV